MKNPKISVIVPYYNTKDYINNCVSHLCSQTISDLMELIFIDDGSTDGTSLAIKEYLEQLNFNGKTKYIIHENNQGIAFSRKEGIENATGDYVIFCDSDDWMEDDMCEKMLEVAEQTDSDLVICDYVNDYDDKPSTVTYPSFIDPFLHNLLLCKITGALWNKLVRKDIYMSNDFIYPTHAFCEDFVFSTQFAIYCKKISYLEEAKYHYCHRGGSIVQSKDEQAIAKRIEDNLFNYKLAESILASHGLIEQYNHEIIALKYVVKNSISSYFVYPGYYRLWRKTFPELTFDIFKSPYVLTRSRIKYFLILFGLYPLLIKLMRK